MEAELTSSVGFEQNASPLSSYFLICEVGIMQTPTPPTPGLRADVRGRGGNFAAEYSKLTEYM